MVAVPAALFSIFTTVLSASLSSGLLSADAMKSSVRMSSTRLSSPLSNRMSEPLVKLPGIVLLLMVFFGDLGGEMVAASRLRPSIGFCRSRGPLRTLSSGRVRMRCFIEPSLPDGILNRVWPCGWMEVGVWGGVRLSLSIVLTDEGGLKVLGGDRNVEVLLGVGIVGEKVSIGDRGVGGMA